MKISIALLIASKTNNSFVRSIRAGLTDIMVPVVQTLATPVNSRPASLWPLVLIW